MSFIARPSLSFPCAGSKWFAGASSILGALFAASSTVAVHAQAAAGAEFAVLHSFGGSGDGRAPTAGVVWDDNGNLYGTTPAGGIGGDGTVYIMSAGGGYDELHSMAGSEGAASLAALTVLPDGTLCGAASAGGVGEGTLFSLSPMNLMSTLHTFSNYDGNGVYGNVDGATPLAGLTLGLDGSLYGTTSHGGAGGGGTVFRLTAAGVFSTLHAFQTTDGATPDSNLVLAPNGCLYGLTQSGGAHGSGSIFKITPSGAFTTLHAFTGASDGAGPCGKLAVDSGGTLYGVTASGGAADCGTIFKLTLQGVFSTLHSFGTISGGAAVAVDGCSPAGGVTIGSDGDLYGSTNGMGNAASGTIFRISPTGAFSTIFTFAPDVSGTGNATGSGKISGVAFGLDGALYGTASAGGQYDGGTVFQLDVKELPAQAGTRFDFNQDGDADLLWYNSATGSVAQWLMDDQSTLQATDTIGSIDPATRWQPVASPDLNGDGYPDLVWWNAETGELSSWTMQGSTILTQNGDFAAVADTDWKPVAAADDGDGYDWSLVFQNTVTGDIARWLMSGTTPIQYGGSFANLGPANHWQIVGAPDLDGDGKSDLLFWNDQTGEVSWWSCDLGHSAVLGFNGDLSQVQDTSWKLVGSEDTNGDGYPDLVWWNSDSGEVSRWLMHGATVAQYGGDTAEVSDTNWQPAAIR